MDETGDTKVDNRTSISRDNPQGENTNYPRPDLSHLIQISEFIVEQDQNSQLECKVGIAASGGNSSVKEGKEGRKQQRLMIALSLPTCLHFPLQIQKFVVTTAEDWKQNHDATRSGVSASIDNNAECTLSVQPSRRSRNDSICGIPKTLGCTHETCTVPSTWSIMPSIR